MNNSTPPGVDLFWQAALNNLKATSKYFWSYALLLVLVFGLIGNALSFVVFIRRRRQDRASATYLTPLAIADLVNCMVGMNLWVVLHLETVSQGAIVVKDITPLGDVGCQLIIIFWSAASFVSAWIVIAFTIERCLVVWFPIKMSVVLSSSNSRVVALVAIVFCAFLYYIPFGFYIARGYYPPNQLETRACVFIPETPEFAHALLELGHIVLNSAVPCIFICFLNVAILLGIWSNKMSTEHKSGSKNEMKCVRNLLVISTVFVMTMTPFAVMRIVYRYLDDTGFHGFTAEAKEFYGALELHTTSISHLNYAINPLLYTFSLAFYRDEVRKIICCSRRKKTRGDPSKTSSD